MRIKYHGRQKKKLYIIFIYNIPFCENEPENLKMHNLFFLISPSDIVYLDAIIIWFPPPHIFAILYFRTFHIRYYRSLPLNKTPWPHLVMAMGRVDG
jgi:hypothetical protein